MVRYEGGAAPAALRILRVRGNSMEPGMREGNRCVVDTARRRPASGELFVLVDGNGLVVKRLEAVPGEPPRLRLLSPFPGNGPPFAWRGLSRTSHDNRRNVSLMCLRMSLVFFVCIP